jgi:hypothetical protein
LLATIFKGAQLRALGHADGEKSNQGSGDADRTSEGPTGDDQRGSSDRQGASAGKYLFLSAIGCPGSGCMTLQ